MQELLKISYEAENPTVSARELHDQLNIGTKFTTWFQRMTEYGFSENTDYKTCYPNLGSENHGGQNMVDYQISVDMAMDTYRYTLFKQAFEERGISIEDKKNPHGIVRLIRKISSATGIIAPFIQSMFSQGLINFGQSAIMRWYTNNTSVTEDKFGNKSFGKIEPKLRKNDGFMAFDVAMFCKDELEVQIIYV